MNENLINQISALPYADKAELLEYLVTEVAKMQNSLILSDDLKKQLDEDHKEYLANPDRGISWDEAKTKILRDNGM